MVESDSAEGDGVGGISVPVAMPEVGMADENGTPTSDSKKMAKILNNFFASVFTAEDPMSADADAEAEQANTTPIEDITIKTSDTRKLIKNLKTAVRR
jgi:hypothetical protein